MSAAASNMQTVKHEAKEYLEISKINQQVYGMEFIGSLASLTEGSKVLDLGCGTGNLTVELAKRVGSKGRVIGVDPDTERLKLARQKNARENIVYVEAHGENFPEDQYDVVFSNYVLHWIENKDAVFKRVYNNLRPGGVFAFSAVQWTPKLNNEISELMGPGKGDEVASIFSLALAKEYKDLATANGFTVTLMDDTPFRHAFPNIQTAIDMWFAITHGKFDPALVDRDTMEKFVQKFEGKPVEIKAPTVKFVVEKPL